MEESICEVEWDKIRVSPFQPRSYSAEEELEELASSIHTVGLIHPPVVRKIEQNGKLLYYELIAGERRWRAMKKCGFKTLKVIVRESTDEHAAKATLIENIQRVDLNPIEMAKAFKRLIDIFKMKQEEVAERVGKKRSTVANYLRLLTLPGDMQGSLVKGAITMGHAKALLSLDDPSLKQILHDLILKNQLTVREAEKQSQKMAKKRVKKNNDVHLVALQEKLQTHFGTKVAIHHHKKQGKIEVSYYGLDDLERLLGLLGVQLD